MKKIILITCLFAVSLFSCDKGEELKVDTEIWMIAKRSTTSGSVLPALFYIFEGDGYDPTTFIIESYWDALSASIRNNKGETILPVAFYFGESGYETYKCNAGKYFIIAAPRGRVPGSSSILLMQMYKAKAFEV